MLYFGLEIYLRMISSSQNDLKFCQAPPSHKSKPSLSNTYVSPRSNGNGAGPTTPTTPSSCQIPTISLNQKCAGCAQVLGQGSAMYIEKLGLAFHLKCFRCSVCHQPLGNGLEGTDVRVSSHNRLHCNSCFSNDLGSASITSSSSSATTSSSSRMRHRRRLIDYDYLLLPNYYVHHKLSSSHDHRHY